jgi:hypothetical protein
LTASDALRERSITDERRNAYLTLRRKYEPEIVRLVVVAESPPASGLYFYNPAGKCSEPLFAALMLQLGFSPSSKEDGLREFQRMGWVLVDATYEPVNSLSDAQRDAVIIRDYPLLRGDLAALVVDRSTPLVLIKANVCRILEPRLAADEFKVLNRGRVIYFPSTGRQRDFQRQFGRDAPHGRTAHWPRAGIRRRRGKTAKSPAPHEGQRHRSGEIICLRFAYFDICRERRGAY